MRFFVLNSCILIYFYHHGITWARRREWFFPRNVKNFSFSLSHFFFVLLNHENKIYKIARQSVERKEMKKNGQMAILERNSINSRHTTYSKIEVHHSTIREATYEMYSFFLLEKYFWFTRIWHETDAANYDLIFNWMLIKRMKRPQM